MLSLIIDDIHICGGIDHVNAIFRTGLRVTSMVCVGDPINWLSKWWQSTVAL